MKKLFVLFIAVAGISVGSYAQTASGDATARILSPVTITKVRTLAFGDLATSGSLGTATIPATSDGQVTAADGVTKVSTNTLSTSAEFTVTGDDNNTYTLTLPADETSTVEKIGGNAASMKLSGFISSLGAGLTPTGTLTAGTQTVYVGATLNVGASQAAGSYSGTFAVAVAYE